MRRWAEREPELSAVENLEALVPACRETRSAHAPAVLRLVRSSDDLAARVLLQLLVPGLVQIAGALHRPGQGPSRCDLRLEVISAAWTQIAAVANGTSGARTTRMILWNVHRETVRCLRRHRGAACDPGRRSRLGHGDLIPIDPVEIERSVTATDGAGGADEARVLLHQAVKDGVLSTSAAHLVWQVAVNDQPTNSAGGGLGMTRQASYRTRDRALHSLRPYLAAS